MNEHIVKFFLPSDRAMALFFFLGGGERYRRYKIPRGTPSGKKVKCAILLLEFRRGAHLPS